MTTSSPPAADTLPPPLRDGRAYLLLLLAVFFAYCNVFDNQFLFDDGLLIQINSYLRGWNHIGQILSGSTTSGAHIAGGFYRPTQILLYLLAYHLGDGATFPFHLLNVSLHAANVCLVYRLGTKMGFDARGALAAALIWSLHPLHTEAITYMSATADTLFVTLLLGALLVMLPDFSWRKAAMAAPLFLLALVSKETSVMFPGMMMVCLFYLAQGRAKYKPATYSVALPFWIASMAFAYWRASAIGFDGPQTYAHFYAMPQFANLKAYAEEPITRLYTFLATLPNYAQLFVWPTGLHMERSFPVYSTFVSAAVSTGALMVVLAGGHIVASLRSGMGAALTWGLLWFGVTHGPDTGLLVPMNSLFLEHWMYLPSVGLFLGLGEIAIRTLDKQPKIWLRAASGVCLCVAMTFGILTYNQNAVWHDPVSFYTNIFNQGVNSSRAHNNLALYYSDHGQLSDAVNEFNAAIQSGDTYAETHYNLALTYLRQGEIPANIEKALTHLQRSLEIEPGFYRSYQTMADIYALLRNDQAQADIYRRRASEILARRPR